MSKFSLSLPVAPSPSACGHFTDQRGGGGQGRRGDEGGEGGGGVTRASRVGAMPERRRRVCESLRSTRSRST
eukprot:749613-Hanusia_phi.AAC.1